MQANTLIIRYLNHLKKNRGVIDVEQLDVAISVLSEALQITDKTASAELLTIIDQAYGAEQVSSEQLKNDGNAAMKAKDFQKARDCYTKAIENSIRHGEPLEPRSVYHANRAMALHEL